MLSETESIPTTRWPCRWNWCRDSYSTKTQLIHHLNIHLLDHKPLKKRDLDVLRARNVNGSSQSKEGKLFNPCSSDIVITFVCADISMSSFHASGSQYNVNGLHGSTQESSQLGPLLPSAPVDSPPPSTQDVSLDIDPVVQIEPPSSPADPPQEPPPPGRRMFSSMFRGAHEPTPSPSPIPPSPSPGALLLAAKSGATLPRSMGSFAYAPSLIAPQSPSPRKRPSPSTHDTRTSDSPSVQSRLRSPKANMVPLVRPQTPEPSPSKRARVSFETPPSTKTHEQTSAPPIPQTNNISSPQNNTNEPSEDSPTSPPSSPVHDANQSLDVDFSMEQQPETPLPHETQPLDSMATPPDANATLEEDEIIDQQILSQDINQSFEDSLLVDDGDRITQLAHVIQTQASILEVFETQSSV